MIENTRGEKHSCGVWMRAAGGLTADPFLPVPACSSDLCAAAFSALETCIQQHLVLAEHVVVSQCLTNIPHPQNG